MKSFALTLLSAITLATAAPLAISPDDLLKNGLEAQKLNAFFGSLSIDDLCTPGEQACLGEGTATCAPEGDWEVTPCNKDLTCFALPEFKLRGTFIACETEENALQIIEKTGVTGGILGDGTTVAEPSESVPSDSESDSVVAVEPTKTDDTTPTSPASTSNVEDDVPTAPTDIPEFSLGLGDEFGTLFPTSSAAPTEDNEVPPSPTDIPEFSLGLGDQFETLFPTSSAAPPDEGSTASADEPAFTTTSAAGGDEDNSGEHTVTVTVTATRPRVTVTVTKTGEVPAETTELSEEGPSFITTITRTRTRTRTTATATATSESESESAAETNTTVADESTSEFTSSLPTTPIGGILTTIGTSVLDASSDAAAPSPTRDILTRPIEFIPI